MKKLVTGIISGLIIVSCASTIWACFQISKCVPARSPEDIKVLMEEIPAYERKVFECKRQGRKYSVMLDQCIQGE